MAGRPKPESKTNRITWPDGRKQKGSVYFSPPLRHVTVFGRMDLCSIATQLPLEVNLWRSTLFFLTHCSFGSSSGNIPMDQSHRKRQELIPLLDQNNSHVMDTGRRIGSNIFQTFETPYILYLPDCWLEARMYQEVPATGHLDTSCLEYPLSSSTW